MSAARERCACPVCRARFRGTAACSRCGADLSALMRLEAQAYRLRALARWHVAAGDFPAARRCALRAQELRATGEGRSLALLTALLA